MVDQFAVSNIFPHKDRKSSLYTYFLMLTSTPINAIINVYGYMYMYMSAYIYIAFQQAERVFHVKYSYCYINQLK